MRINWDEYALSLAHVAKLRSEDPFRQVGACALDHENRVLGVAYNGLKSGTVVPEKFWSDRNKRRPYKIHAEANLLSLFEIFKNFLWKKKCLNLLLLSVMQNKKGNLSPTFSPFYV